MARVRYKVKCCKCRKNYVIVTRSTNFPVCYDCEKNELVGEIKDPVMKKMFDIPEELYKTNSFIRNIKINYLKWGKLSEKQIAAFEKAIIKEAEEKVEKEAQAILDKEELALHEKEELAKNLKEDK